MTFSVTEAAIVLQAQAANLTAAFRAKGYDKTHVEIWIGRFDPGHTLIFVDKEPAGWGYLSAGPDLVALIAEAYTMIAALPDNRAYDAEFSGPLVGPPITEAAE
jgi:hypothetical protein